MVTKLTGKKIGVYFGTFAPLHLGHQQQIYKCASLNDGMLLVASGYDGDRGFQIGLPLEKRFRYLCEAFSDEEDIKVVKLNENDLPEMPNGWNEWMERLLELIDSNTSNEALQVTFYVGEKEYVKELECRFPKDKKSYAVEIANRTDIQLSATEIRENPMAHWSEINPVFRRHFTKIVTVMGASQTGKSTLVRRLAHSIGAPFSKEYGKFYKEQFNLLENELELKDYIKILIKQYEWNSNCINAFSNLGLTFLDTDAITTATKAKMNLSKKDYQELDPLLNKIISSENKDLILVIPPYVQKDENFEQDKGNLRQTFHEVLMDQLSAFNLMDKVVLLDKKGNPHDPKGYLSRYHQAIDVVYDYTGIKIERLG